MPQATYLGACGLLMCSALAQAQPGVTEILQKVSRSYKAASSYELVADVAQPNASGQKGETGHILFAFRSPNRYRLELSEMGGARSTRMVVVHDGSFLWIYSPETNEYDAAPAGRGTNGAAGDQGLAPAEDPFLMWRYRGAADFAEGAKFLREETIEIDGAKVDCYVLTVSPERNGSRLTYTWWVEKKHSHVVRDDDAESSSVYTTIKLEEPLPDDLFRFEPPPGARQRGK
jgi:outer membrane lipoprotein-sorting protein